MPIYEYQCTNCDHAFELIQKINEEAATQCEQCGKNTAVRLVSAAGFQLKGTGWYVTDFKDKPKPQGLSDKKSTETSTAQKASAPAQTESSQPADKKIETSTKTTQGDSA